MSEKRHSIKRRDFLSSSAAATGLLLTGNALGQERPCPPVLTGSGAGTAVGCGGNAEQDWQARIAGPGVVWFHDFRDAAEVDAFRWCSAYRGGNDPLDLGTSRRPDSVRRITSDGITGGGCLELFRGQGGSESKDWWRPWSPFASPGNGKDQDDPAASSTIPLRTWNPTDGGSQTYNFSGGNYGPSSTGEWDGNEFYLQLAMKLDSRRRDSGVNGGKISYLTRTEVSLTSQELVTYYKNSQQFSIYRGGSPEVPSDIANVNHIWDEWAYYLYHVVPGDSGGRNTTIEVWRARIGEPQYTKIFETFDEQVYYDNGYDHAWNALICSIYHNGINMPSAFFQRYDQIIFSQEFIPCPQV